MNTKLIAVICLAMHFQTGCPSHSIYVPAQENQVAELTNRSFNSPLAQSNPDSTAKMNIPERSISGTNGLIVLSDKYGKNDFIRFYNDDGSLWYEFTFYYDDSDGKFDYENENFAPFAFHPDYFLLALKYVGENKRWYEVIVNEETGLKKFVKKNDPALRIETWKRHILKTFAVTFDENTNPLRESPNGNLKKVETSKIERFEAVDIKSDWLKIKWETQADRGEGQKQYGSGWIKWKEGEKLIIEWFNFA